jgi:hypothetical protein
MGEQTSRKSGVRSTGQKEASSRSFAPIGSTSPVPGAFGEKKKQTPTDEDTALIHHTKRKRREEKAERDEG